MKKLYFFCCYFWLIALCNSFIFKPSKNINLESRVKFYLFTLKNPQTPQLLIIDNINSVEKSNFDATLETKILIHGWKMSYQGIPNPELREAYLSQGNYNIISVDWQADAKSSYLLARDKVDKVGKVVAKFVDFLNEKMKMSFQSLVVIGHSLGAHVAGFCGKSVTRGKLPAIVGLDTAYPAFTAINSKARLANTDADFVLTIHSNGKFKGFLNPIGDASFYPNWGSKQPGCGADLLGDCSHDRCVYYYAEVIKGYTFAPYFKCDSFTNILLETPCTKLDKSVQIGDPTKINHVPGIFYFETRSYAPFGYL